MREYVQKKIYLQLNKNKVTNANEEIFANVII